LSRRAEPERADAYEGLDRELSGFRKEWGRANEVTSPLLLVAGVTACPGLTREIVAGVGAAMVISAAILPRPERG